MGPSDPEGITLTEGQAYAIARECANRGRGAFSKGSMEERMAAVAVIPL